MGVVGDALASARQVMNELLESDPTLAAPENWQVLQDTVEGESNAMDLARWFARKKVELDRDLADRLAVIDSRKKELAEKQARVKSLERRIEKLADIAFTLARAATPDGKKVEIKAPGVTGYLQAQGDKQRALVEVEASATPDEFIKERTAVYDKDAIKARLLARKSVPGWQLANAKEWFVIKSL